MPIDQATLKQLAINNPVNDSGAYYPYPEFSSHQVTNSSVDLSDPCDNDRQKYQFTYYSYPDWLATSDSVTTVANLVLYDCLSMVYSGDYT